MTKFSKPPQPKTAEDFINSATEIVKEKPTREKIRHIHVRAPKSLLEDIQEISAICGLSINAICLDILRPGIKRKLKELREE